MSSIEDRLDQLAKKIEVLAARLDKLDENELCQDLKIGLLEIPVETLERFVQRWDEVYYHVFPERAPQDLQFERQLHHLNCPPKREDGTDKS